MLKVRSENSLVADGRWPTDGGSARRYNSIIIATYVTMVVVVVDSGINALPRLGSLSSLTTTIVTTTVIE